MRLQVLVSSLVLSFAVALVAEEPPTETPPAATTGADAPSAPPSQTRPSTPPPEMDALSAFVGTWNCEGNGGDPGAPMTMRATMTIARDLDGFWYSGREAGQKMPQGPKPTTRLFYWSWDSIMKQFVGGWLDSHGDWLTHTSTGWQADKLAFIGHIATGPARRSARETFTRPNDVGFMRTFEALENLQWVVVSQETCRRGKPAAKR